MTKDEKIARIEAIREKKRRILKAKPTYKPNKGQLLVHQDDRRIRVVTSGNGFGKTCLGVQEALWWATGWNPITEVTTKVPATVVVVLDSPAKVADIWMKEIAKWYPIEEIETRKNGKPHISELFFKNGSNIQFMFHLQEELAFEGIELDYCCFDEPSPKHVFIGLMRGARKKGSKPKFLFIGTPLGQPWIYQTLVKPAQEGLRPDIGLHRYSTEMNVANLADGYIEDFKRNLTEKEMRTRLYGEFSHLDALALARIFDREVHVIPRFIWPKGKPVVIAIDPAQAKPHTAIMLGVTGDGRLYYITELASKSHPGAFARELRDWYQGYKVVDIICDSFGEIPGTGGEGNLSFSDKLRQQGVRCRSTSFKDKSDEDFINKIKQILEIPEEKDNFGRKVPLLSIFEGNKGIITDIENVMWQKHRKYEGFKEKLEISNRDYLACLKYALTTHIVFMSSSLKSPKTLRSGRSPWSGGAISKIR